MVTQCDEKNTMSGKDDGHLTFIRRRAIYGADLEVLAVRTHPMCCAAGI